MSAGFTGYDSQRDEPIVGAVVAVRNREAAEDFMDDWLDYLDDSEGADFSRDSYQEFEVWEAEDEGEFYGLSDDWLVYAHTQRGLRDLMDGIAGDLERTLADMEEFQAARATLPERRFASLYVDVEEAADLAETLADAGSGWAASGFGSEHRPEWIAGAASWSELAVTLEFTAPMGIDHPLQVANLEDPADRFPVDTMVFADWAFDPDMDNWRAVMRNYRIGETFGDDEVVDSLNDGMSEILGGNARPLGPEDTADELLDRALALVEDLSGFDLERDFMDHLDGELAIAMMDADFEDIGADPAGNPVEMVMMLSYRDDGREELEDTLRDVARQVEDQTAGFVESDRVNLGSGAEGIVFRLSDLLLDTTYSPGYALHDGYLTLASTEGVLRAIVALQGGDSLGKDAEYGRVAELLPGERQWMLFVDIHRLLRRLADTDVGEDSDGFEVAREAISRLAASAHFPHCRSGGGADCEILPGEVGRVRIAVTLFPE